MYHIGTVIVLYQCIAAAVCYVRLAAAAERRHVNPGHVSTSETLQPGTPLTPHTTHNTTHCLHYTQPFEHLDTVTAASPDQRHIQWSSLHDNSKYKIPLPSPLSRNYHVAAVQI